MKVRGQLPWSGGRAALVAVMVAVAGCGTSETDASPSMSSELSPRPSVPETLRSEADVAVAALLERMADPDVTYRVAGELIIGEENSDGLAPAEVSTHYDVAGDDFAGFVRIRGHAIPEGGAADYHAVVIDGTTSVWGTSRLGWLSEDTPNSIRSPNPFLELNPADFEFIGMTDDGHLEYEVMRWIGGDPIGEWTDVGLIEGGPLTPASVQSHETRLIVDADGVPIRLSGSWTFTAGRDGAPGDGSFVDDYSAFGLYVNAAPPRLDGVPSRWSHDVVVGVDETHTFITEPFVEVLPPAHDSAELSIGFERPAQPIFSLGIEGVIVFLRSHAPNGDLAMDRIVSSDGETVDIPTGEMTLVVAYRPCDGSCAFLDPHTDFCSIDAEIERDARYELLVQIQTAERADCLLRPAAGG